ncbi:MAG: hypothetical protein PWP04_1611 [Candidatus Atribacteria bacterium]|nr:hypothetical protein [Candidatus Atribacteria bacterium]
MTKSHLFLQKKITIGNLIVLITFLSVIIPSYSLEAAVRKANPFTLYTLEGKEIPFESPTRFSLLYFLSPHCFPCLNDLSLFSLETIPENIDIYPICAGCTWRETIKVENSVSGNLTVYLAPADLKPLWGIWEFPTAFLVDPNMKVIRKWEGEIDLSEVNKLVDSLSRERGRRSGSPNSSSDSCNGNLCY